MTIQDLIYNALTEIGVIAQGETLSAADANFALSKANDMFDEWSARKVYAYSMDFTAYTLIPGLSPHTIGPSGATFTVPVRPMRIESATIILNTSSPNVEIPIAIRDDQWWANERVKSLLSQIPTDLYYNPKFPNGELYFWPVPNLAY